MASAASSLRFLKFQLRFPIMVKKKKSRKFEGFDYRERRLCIYSKSNMHRSLKTLQERTSKREQRVIKLGFLLCEMMGEKGGKVMSFNKVI